MRSLSVSLYWKYFTLSQKVAKNFFSQKSTRVTLPTVFDLRNEFHEHRFCGKILFLSILTPHKAVYVCYPIFAWGNRKNWSHDDLQTSQIPARRSPKQNRFEESLGHLRIIP